MARLNRITLIGTLTEEPRLAPESLGKNAASLNVVVKDTWIDKEKKIHETKDFFTIKLYGAPASYAAMNLGKDSCVLIIGKLRNEKWIDKETNTHKYKTVVVVDKGEGLQGLGRQVDDEFEEDNESYLSEDSISKNIETKESVKTSTIDAGSSEFEEQHGLQKVPF